jgi:hypothetical protein
MLYTHRHWAVRGSCNSSSGSSSSSSSNESSSSSSSNGSSGAAQCQWQRSLVSNTELVVLTTPAALTLRLLLSY